MQFPTMSQECADRAMFRVSRLVLLTLFFHLFLPAATRAAVIHVPADYATIQQAIDSAEDGDSVVVAPGTYVENIDFSGKNLVVESSGGPEMTVIDGGGSGSVVTFVSGESRAAVIKGFTIANGGGTRLPATPSWRGGGGIFCSNSSAPLITGNIISNHQHSYLPIFGAGICSLGSADPAITGNLFSDNIATHGGGIMFQKSTGVVTGNTFSENTAESSGWGGAIYCIQARPRISDNTFSSNTAGSGGAITCIGDRCDPLITGNSFDHNTASSVGGAVACFLHSAPRIEGNHFEENEAYDGGALHAQNCYPRIRANEFIDNTASHLGGAIYHLRYRVEISGNLIVGNEAERGGAVFCYLGKPDLVNNLIYGNRATIYGGAVGLSDAEFDIFNCTITGNEAGNSGGAVYCDTWSELAVRNSILWGNTAPQSPEIHNSGSGNITVDYCDISGGHPGTENFDSHPLFTIGPDGDFYLSQIAAGQPAESPCVDAGDPTSSVQPGTTRTDELPDTASVDLGFHYLMVSTSATLVAGPGPGPTNPPLVRIFLAGGIAHEGEITVLDTPGYGVNVTCADSNGDLVSEILIGAGPGPTYGSHVRGFTQNGHVIRGLDFHAFGTAGFGVNIAAGDLDGDGCDEIITGAGPGPWFGPQVRGWNHDGSTRILAMADVNFFAYGSKGYGVEISAGDIDGDRFDEIITGAGPGSTFGSHVRGWDVDDAVAAAISGVSFLAYHGSRFGVQVACGDLDGDGIDEIITAPGPDPSCGAHIRGWNYDGHAITALPGFVFSAWPTSGARFGARIHSGVDLDWDGRDDVVIGQGPDPEAQPVLSVISYDPEGASTLYTVQAFPADWSHGLRAAIGTR